MDLFVMVYFLSQVILFLGLLMYANEVELEEKEKLPEIKKNNNYIIFIISKDFLFPFLYKSYQRDCKDVTWWYVEL